MIFMHYELEVLKSDLHLAMDGELDNLGQHKIYHEHLYWDEREDIYHPWK